jgi:hypothetical protein
MKRIFCKVHGKPAVIVGYAPGRKGKVMAVVMIEGQIRAVKLRQIELGHTFEQLLKDLAANHPRQAEAP